MNYQDLEKYSFVLEENQVLYDIHESETEIHLFIKTKKHECECPECHTKTTEVVAVYERVVQDTPILNKTVYLHIKVGKYRCSNEACSCKVFSEKLDLVERNQRRTKRLNEFILAGGAFSSAKSAQLTLKLQGVQISHDSIQRLFNQFIVKDCPDVKNIGIDEVAIKKGKSYATVIYNYDDGSLLELLEGRKAEDVIPWLQAHQSIEVVARDRSSSYTKAINTALPNSKQVADRFHLFQNLTQNLENWNQFFPKEVLYFKKGELQESVKKQNYFPEVKPEVLKKLEYDNSPPVDKNGNEILVEIVRGSQSKKIEKERSRRRVEKKKLVEEVRDCYAQHPDLSFIQLGEKFNITRKTAAKYVRMSSEEVENLDKKRKNNYLKKTKVDDYLNIMYKMLRDGYKFSVISSYLKDYKGYTGTESYMKQKLIELARKYFPNYNALGLNDFKILQLPEDIDCIRPFEVRKMIMKNDPTELETQRLEAVMARYPIYRDYKEIYSTFHEIIMSKGELEIETFISKYKHVLPEFCKGLEEDIEAVRLAITTSTNSGFVEGNNNKIKLIKRILYGRSGIVNLKKRCALAFVIDHEDFEFSEYFEILN